MVKASCIKVSELNVPLEVEMSYSYWKLICKTLKVYSSSVLKGGLEMLLNLLDSTGIKDSSQLKSTCFTGSPFTIYSASCC